MSPELAEVALLVLFIMTVGTIALTLAIDLAVSALCALARAVRRRRIGRRLSS